LLSVRQAEVLNGPRWCLQQNAQAGFYSLLLIHTSCRNQRLASVGS